MEILNLVNLLKGKIKWKMQQELYFWQQVVMKTNRLCPGHNNIPHKQPGKNLCPAGVDSSIFCLKIGGFFTILNVDFL